MNTELKTTRTKQILTVMHVLTWIAFIGLMIEAGAILISFGVSCFNSQASKDLYQGLSMHSLREYNFWHYTVAVSMKVALIGMKGYVLFMVIKALSKVKLMNPFTVEIAQILEKMSYVLFGAWILALINNGYSDWLVKRTGILHAEWSTGEFIFMAGIVFIIAQVFKRGVEIQSENDLTV